MIMVNPVYVILATLSMIVVFSVVRLNELSENIYLMSIPLESSLQSVPVPFPFMAGVNSKCDIRTEDCSNFQILGQDFVNSPHLGCKIRPVAVMDSSEWSYMDGPLDSRVQFTDDKTVHCSIRESFIRKVSKSYENIILEIEITNTGEAYSNGVFLTLFNSSCHMCSDTLRPLLPTECTPRKDICTHETECFIQGAGHPSNPCLQCAEDGWKPSDWVADIFNGNNFTKHIIEGDRLEFELPVRQKNTLLKIKIAPPNTFINDGKLMWNTFSGNAENETFVIEGVDSCEHKQELLLVVTVLKCECGNNGICLMEGESVICECYEGFSGMLPLFYNTLILAFRYLMRSTY